jgi:biotin carboxyl carrier protein
MVTRSLDRELGSAELEANFEGPDGTTAVVGPIQGKVFKMLVEAGQAVKRGETSHER